MTGQDRERGVEWVALPDGRRWPGRVRNGLPEFGFRQAPAGLSTRRQLRDKGLSRGGQEPVARLTWKKAQRFAWLYLDDKAKPKRTPTAAQLAAVNKALAARKVCAECGPVEHFVRTTDRLCGDCHADGVTPTAGGTAGWRIVHDWEHDTADPTDDEADAAADDDEAAADDDEADDEAGLADTEPGEASAAADRAAEALARATARLDADRADDPVAERDEQLARWHDDDQAARTAAEETDTTGDQDWSHDERGVA